MKLFTKFRGKHHINIWFPWKIEIKKKVYVVFIYSLTIIGHQETATEATKLHNSSCDKNRDKLWQ